MLDMEPDCRFFMPSAVMGPSKEGYVWVINDAEEKMYVWEEEQESIVNLWVP